MAMTDADETACCPCCSGRGYVEGPGCNCGVGPQGYYGMHERHCGLEPCPRGCTFVGPVTARCPSCGHVAATCDGYECYWCPEGCCYDRASEYFALKYENDLAADLGPEALPVQLTGAMPGR